MGTMKTFILLAAMTALFMAVGYLVGGTVGMAIAFAVALVMNVTEEERSPVLRTFANDTRALAEHAGLPQPRIYVIDTPQPNAFATGRDPKHAAVCATTGLLNALTREEVAGVMAHELAHVQHRDTLTMTVTATIAGAIGMLANFALFFGNRERGGLITSIAIMIFAPMAAALVQMAISRSREYEADRLGAEICGNPHWLASALEKIDRGARSTLNQRAEANPAMAHMYIMNPLAGKGADNLFSTHPSTANRIEALRKLAAEMNIAPSGKLAEPEPARAAGPWG